MDDAHRVKILLVDDKQENLLSLQVVLAGQGYEFVEARSGKDALRILLRDQDFAIILMDVQMPLMDGFETAEMIRQSDKLKHVPIIFLTANMDRSEYIFKGYQAGAVDYMIKPLSPEILKAKVLVFADLYKKNHELQVKEDQMRELNEALMDANRELAKRNQEIENHAQELALANKELEAFTYVSSHDLQEPLRKIQTFISLIMLGESDKLSEKGKHQFERVQLAAERMRQLIESLLAFSRTNATERKFESTNLREILDDVVTELQEKIEAKNALVDVSDVCHARIIPFQFAQLMQNLMSNALKFTHPVNQPHILVKARTVKGSDLFHDRLSPDRDYCHITVRDNGIGFDAAFSERIFEVFQKLHSRDVYEGTGIGLAIVKKIVDNHNGFITASSEVMNGARFDIFIPN